MYIPKIKNINNNIAKFFFQENIKVNEEKISLFKNYTNYLYYY